MKQVIAFVRHYRIHIDTDNVMWYVPVIRESDLYCESLDSPLEER